MLPRLHVRNTRGSRQILCRNCKVWKQAPNPEMGTCTCDKKQHLPTNYDTRCLFGVSERVDVPEIETVRKKKL